MNFAVKNLISEYRRRKPAIRARLEEFASVHKGTDEDIFRELCFCILTANANALSCDSAMGELKKRDLLAKGNPCEIIPHLRGRVRFHNKKAAFLVEARKLFQDSGRIKIKAKVNFNDIFKLRDWLVENIKGYGYKEASHFLRNIGLGQDIAILDRHILKNLRKYGVIKKIPESVGSRKVYLYIENKMRDFSKKVKIPLEEMDLLFWSMQTGFIFK